MEDMPRLEPRTRKGGGFAGHKESSGPKIEERRGGQERARIEELGPLLTSRPKGPHLD